MFSAVPRHRGYPLSLNISFRWLIEFASVDAFEGKKCVVN